MEIKAKLRFYRAILIFLEVNMLSYRLLILVLLMSTVGKVKGQEVFYPKKDLRSDWLTFTSGSYTSFRESNSQPTIYFNVPVKNSQGDYLLITSKSRFSLLVNNQLILQERLTATLSVDSLSKLFHGNVLFFALHQSSEIDIAQLTTIIGSKTVTKVKADNENFLLKSKSHFRDFAISALLILVIFLISMVRLNPRLSADYFSVTKIFSLRDYENDQFYYRFTSGTILFYVFTSLVLSFYLMVISQFADTTWSSLSAGSYFGYLFIWLKISLGILGLLAVKITITHTMASLFGVKDIAGFHFFNFTRLILVSIGIFSLVVAFYYILRGQANGFYSFFYSTLTWILIAWMIILFLKLVNRVQYAVFHIFSYICATEIIPFLLIVKVLNQ